MNNKIKKFLAISGITLILGGASTAYAANTFSFSFHTQVVGKKEFNLKNKVTYCDSRAATYEYNTKNYANFVGHYSIELDGNDFWKPDYKGTSKKADDRVYTTNYNKDKNNIPQKIRANTYTVNIGSKDDLTSRCLQITGNGTLKQK